MNRYLVLIFAGLLTAASVWPQESIPKYFNTGISSDILPYAASLITGENGYSFQGWISCGKMKLRAVAAQIYLPEKIREAELSSHEINVLALIVDYYFSEINKGLWAGSGIEFWKNRASDNGSEKSWDNIIFTLGSGYTFMMGRHFYINPFAAVHYNPSPENISLKNSTIEEELFQFSASAKIGWMF